MRATGGIHLLEAEPGLGEQLDPEELEEARRLIVVPAFDISPGVLDLDAVRDADGVAGHCWGMLIVSGAVLNHVRLMDRTCSRLFLPGELVLLDGPINESIPTTWQWTVKRRSRIALLDSRVLVAGQRWPLVMRAVHERAAQVGRHGILNRAISQLPRVEDRLLAFFWMLADQRGSVRSDGIWLDVSLTHDELGQLIGARRPTISLGLRKLADEGHVTAEEDGFLLSRDSLSQFTNEG
jgi:CRP/FNR family cyclic AMP-dependent transcriptional regulator